MHRGYVKLWRRSFESTVWANPKLWRFWSWCLMKATHREIKQQVGYQTVDLKPGQFIFGLNQCSKETGLSVAQVRSCVAFLNGRKLTRKATNKFSIVSINNWHTYQMSEGDTNKQNSKQITSKQQSNNNQITTNKNDKNNKNEKNTYTNGFLTFWKAYPKKTGKKDASKAWKLATDKPAIENLLKILERHKICDQWTKDNGAFIPNPATWLRQGRWDDELPESEDEKWKRLTSEKRS